VSELIDIFPPEAPALVPSAGLGGAGPAWLAVLLLLMLVLALGLALLWRRRLALRAWWLARCLARGQRPPRTLARQALALLHRAFGPAPCGELAELRARLDALSYGRAVPDSARLGEALARLRAQLRVRSRVHLRTRA